MSFDYCKTWTGIKFHHFQDNPKSRDSLLIRDVTILKNDGKGGNLNKTNKKVDLNELQRDEDQEVV